MNAVRSIVAGMLCLVAGMTQAVPLYQCPLTVSGYAEGKAALADFPVLVRISTAIDQFNYGDCAAGGADISFTSEDGETVYPHEVDTWNPDGESLVWVKLPSMAHGTKFLFRWADPNPLAKNDPTQVWPGYIGVWHFSSLVESTTVKNSARNDYDLKFPEGKTGSIAENAPAGMGLFCENGTMRTKDYEPEFKVGGKFTATGWFYLPTYSGTSGKYAGFVSKKVGLDWNANTGWYLQMNQSKTTVGLVESGSTETKYASLPDVTKNWNHFALISDGTYARAYFNGSSSAGINRQTEIKASSTEFQVGGSGDYIDEFRLRKGAVSVDWAGAEYATVAMADYLTAGTTEIQSLGAVAVSSDGLRYGEVSPDYGRIAEPEAGTTYDFSCTVATQMLNEAGTTRAVCTGWELRRLSDGGLIRTSSSEGEQTFACSHTYVQGEGVELMWRWTVQHLVTTKTATTGGGTVEPSEAWVVEGEDVTVTFTPDATHGFYKWAGDVAAASEKTNPLTFTVDGPKAIEVRCTVVAQVTTGEELIAAVEAASETEPSVIEIGELDIYLLETVNLTKPITLRGAGIGKTVLRRDSSVSSLRMLKLSNASAAVEDLTVTNGYYNNQGRAAGAYVTAGTLRRCEFYNCHIGARGTSGWNQGHCVVLEGSNSRAIGCIIRGISVDEGDALWVVSKAVAESCLICDNESRTTGNSGCYMVNCSEGTLRGCTIVNNYMGNSVALYNANGNGRIKDCIVYGNRGSVATSGGLGNGFDIAGTINSTTVQNTLVTDPGFRDFANKNYAIGPGPAVDAALSGAETLALTEVDAAGAARKVGEAVDIGALECPQDKVECAFIPDKTSVLAGEEVVFHLYSLGAGENPTYTIDFGDGSAPEETSDVLVLHAYENPGSYTVTVSVPNATPYAKANALSVKPKNLYVKPGVTGTPPYASEETAAGYVEDALAEAGDGCTIWIAAGNYTFKANQKVSVEKGVKLVGLPTATQEVVFSPHEANKHEMFRLNHADAGLYNLAIEGGYNSGGNQRYVGANVVIESVGGTVSNCVLRNISSCKSGDSALAFLMKGGLMTHCVISNIYGSSAAAWNHAGAGAYMSGGTLVNSLLTDIRGSGSSIGTGAVIGLEGNSKIVNCTIAGNSMGGCAGIYFNDAKPKVTNTLVCNNTSTKLPEAWKSVYGYGNSANATTAKAAFVNCASAVELNNTCVMTNDFKLRNADAHEYHLLAGSPCRDAGKTSGVDVGLVDLDGNPRIDESGSVDIGCYEFTVSGLSASISADPLSATGVTPLKMTFMADVEGGVPTGYRWFEDGEELSGETGSTLVRTYTTPGKPVVSLKVSDGTSEYDAANTIAVTVYPAVLNVDADHSLDEAYAAAGDGTLILVEPNTYKINTYWISKGVTIRGLGTDPAAVTFVPKSSNSRVFALNHEGAKLENLTIANGSYNQQGDPGSGVYIYGKGGTVSNCVIASCSHSGDASGGGGAYLGSVNAVVTHCVITNCTSSRSRALGNTHCGGAAILLDNGLVRETLIANCRGGEGTAETDGAISIYGGKVVNCTIANCRNGGCPGVRVHGGSVINTIISGNTTTSTSGMSSVYVGSASVFDSCLSDGEEPINATCHVEPSEKTFRGFSRGNYVIRGASVGRDKGKTLTDAPATDLRGRARLFGKSIDIGCYESDTGGLTVLVK